jgi:hypothetical protein
MGRPCTEHSRERPRTAAIQVCRTSGMTGLTGVFPVISTPFTDADELDGEVLQREIDWLVDCGVDGLTIAMVSEVLRLSEAERRELAELTVQYAAGRVPSRRGDCLLLQGHHRLHRDSRRRPGCLGIPGSRTADLPVRRAHQRLRRGPDIREARGLTDRTSAHLTS